MCKSAWSVGLIDETSALKSGTKTPGVQRQYLGCVGKITNGIVTVHLGVCRGRYKTLCDAECPSGKCVKLDSPVPAGAWDGMPLGRV